jgi:hypothetical protein
VTNRDESSAVFHDVYGFRLAANVAIPGLPVSPSADGIADIQIRLKQKASLLSATVSPSEVFYISGSTDANGGPVLRAAILAGGTHLALLYCDGTRFVLERNGYEVFADWPNALALEDVSPYLLGPVLGLVLRLRGIFPLHASAVSIDDHAIALMGPAGAGKSTTAAAFARSGFRVISDDVVALRQDDTRFVIPPGYPRVNLWSDSVRALFGVDSTLPLISPGWDKHFMPLDRDGQFETRSLPLGAIYILNRREPSLARPITEEMASSEALIALLGNTYMNHLPDPVIRRREFEVLMRVLAQVPLRRVRAPEDSSMLPDLCKTIAADARKLLQNASQNSRQHISGVGLSLGVSPRSIATTPPKGRHNPRRPINQEAMTLLPK